MPLKTVPKRAKKAVRRRIASQNIAEFTKGGTFQRTTKKFGLAKARRQAVAVGLRTAGLSRKGKKGKRKS